MTGAKKEVDRLLRLLEHYVVAACERLETPRRIGSDLVGHGRKWRWLRAARREHIRLDGNTRERTGERHLLRQGAARMRRHEALEMCIAGATQSWKGDGIL